MELKLTVMYTRSTIIYLGSGGNIVKRKIERLLDLLNLAKKHV
jgi:hypothetical protein